MANSKSTADSTRWLCLKWQDKSTRYAGGRVVKWGGGLHYKHTNLERETITLEHVSSVLFKNSSTVMESSSGSSHRQVELISSSTASIRQSRISVTYTTDNAQVTTSLLRSWTDLFEVDCQTLLLYLRACSKLFQQVVKMSAVHAWCYAVATWWNWQVHCNLLL